MTVIIDIAKHALTITGFVAVMMLVVEYVNVLTQGTWQTHLTRNPWGQYLVAAFLGATPGCLGAFAVVGMYGHGVLTHGAVITPSRRLRGSGALSLAKRSATTVGTASAETAPRCREGWPHIDREIE